MSEDAEAEGSGLTATYLRVIAAEIAVLGALWWLERFFG